MADKQALVLSGGGARAAYQVGALRYIAKRLPDYRPQILTGVSAGAINAIHLASAKDPWPQAVEQLSSLWLSLSTDQVYDTRIGSLLRRILTWGLRVLSSGRLGREDLRGMVNSEPLRRFLLANVAHEAGRFRGVEQNIASGLLESLAVMTTNYATGRSIAWVESAGASHWQQGQQLAVPTELNIDHIMASAALPMFFPAVRLESAWHGDGGIRLTAPLSPARHLGATRILAVSPRAKPTKVLPEELHEPYPSPAQIAGVLLNAVFLDSLDFDALQIDRMNRLLGKIPSEQHDEFAPVEVMILRPRADLGQLAAAHEIELPKSFRFFSRGLTNRNASNADALSMVIFEREYLALLMRLGEEDAAARGDEIEAFIRGGVCDEPV